MQKCPPGISFLGGISVLRSARAGLEVAESRQDAVNPSGAPHGAPTGPPAAPDTRRSCEGNSRPANPRNPVLPLPHHQPRQEPVNPR